MCSLSPPLHSTYLKKWDCVDSVLFPRTLFPSDSCLLQSDVCLSHTVTLAESHLSPSNCSQTLRPRPYSTSSAANTIHYALCFETPSSLGSWQRSLLVLLPPWGEPLHRFLCWLPFPSPHTLGIRVSWDSELCPLVAVHPLAYSQCFPASSIWIRPLHHLSIRSQLFWRADIHPMATGYLLLDVSSVPQQHELSLS